MHASLTFNVMSITSLLFPHPTVLINLINIANVLWYYLSVYNFLVRIIELVAFSMLGSSRFVKRDGTLSCQLCC